jgi:SAM-dependent methyltransferase
MDAATYAVEAQIEVDHWWFVGRRRLFGGMIGRLDIPADANVLDIGVSSGTNLRMLVDAGYRRVTGLDSSDEAIRWCRLKGLPPVDKGDVCALPYADDTFDLVLATDVIEHVDDHYAAVREIRRVLKPGGYALITVPAFRSLWGLQDEVSHHKRRYRLGELLRVTSGAGLQITERFYFNFILFVPIWLARQILRASKPALRSENEVNSPLINAVLTRVFALDISLAPLLRLPFGVSALALARKPRLEQTA